MDLIQFKGTQSVYVDQPVEHQPLGTESSKSFVPLGRSVIPYTERLFGRKRSSKNVLKGLIALSNNSGVDPDDFDASAQSTLATLIAMAEDLAVLANPALRAALQGALPVLDELKQHREFLYSKLAELQRA